MASLDTAVRGMFLDLSLPSKGGSAIHLDHLIDTLSPQSFPEGPEALN